MRLRISTSFLGRLLLPALCALLITFCAIAAPKSQLWPYWQSSNDANAAAIDHRIWQDLLSRYLATPHPSGIARFSYARVSPSDKANLNRYLVGLQQLDPRAHSRAEQIAYWINLYNALTVKLVLDHYPVQSIREIHEGLIAFGPWDDPVAEVAGQRLTLNDIEHRILRPIWKDPRIHYVVNCASLGCPNLAREAFTAANAERLLEQGARSYINHPRGVQFKGDGLTVSSIYFWYREDFGGTDEALLRHLISYAEPQLAARLRSYSGGIDYEYDWRLNEP